LHVNIHLYIQDLLGLLKAERLVKGMVETFVDFGVPF
jgi:hypothetical protein